SKIISEHSDLGFIKASFLLVGSFSLLIAILMLGLSYPISILQGNSSLYYSYAILSPTLIIIAFSSILKGWFLGNFNSLPTALSQVIEQVVKIVFGLLFAYFLVKKSLLFGVLGALLAILLSEVSSFITLLICFLKDKKSFALQMNFKTNAKKLVKVNTPILLVNLMLPIMAFIDSILLVKLLQMRGHSFGFATGLYGLLTGSVNSLINMPIVFALSISIVVVPIISKSVANKNLETIKQKGGMAIKISYLIGVPSMFGLYALARPILLMLYPTLNAQAIDTTISLLQISSVNVILLSQLQVYVSLLQALNKTKICIISILVSSIVRIILEVVLVGYADIYGASLAIVLSLFVGVIINLIFYNKYLGHNKKLLKSVSKILVCSVIMFLAVFSVTKIVNNIYFQSVFGMIVGVAVYFIFIFAFKVIEDNEILSLPYGDKILSKIKRRKQ
ncbi:MAG: polysaccharide biosynthesis C-terminal domain-containing protein, partial [Clostridia bacterium]